MAIEATAGATKLMSNLDRPLRPNYGLIHANPLPLKIHPLPPLIPHNPLSIVHVACTYIYQLFFPPPSQPKPRYQGYWSPETRSVHVTDEDAARALWEGGFFGKGSLSRSEPTWLDREKRRKGIIAGETSEEVTKKRREERKQFKVERARKEREAIEEKLKEEQSSMWIAKSNAVKDLSEDNSTGIKAKSENFGAIAETHVTTTYFTQNLSEPLPLEVEHNDEHLISRKNLPEATLETKSSIPDSEPITNQEHLQLTPEEAFFLTYALGTLHIHPTLTLTHLLTLFRSHSYFPPSPLPLLRPNDPFLPSYITYHHFRSLGWVVRPGTKFAVDFLLYARGPVFSHAEFAVVVVPAYRDKYWREEGRKEETKRRERRGWTWLHCVNRVQSQVRKSLVVCFVEIPPPVSGEEDGDGVEGVTKLLKRYRVREFVVRRWVPNRSRD